ncbi:MAG: histidine kinase [Rhizobiales bacterium]|nr:histidine kinase [Hyphomicrobiales bacterium]
MALDAIRARRSYQAWVANETIEDYSLRYAASSFRKWSPFVIANTALGGISFLALEAIGGAITISYGFANAFPAILLVSLLIFITSLPIAYYSSRYNIDMDLLTRGAGFGYIGSTVTSLIYACFTFIFFALEAAIMAQALFLYVGLPITLGYIVSSIVIIPIVFLGATMISRLQMVTQPLWIFLLLTPFVMILIKEPGVVGEWVAYAGARADGGGFDYLYFGAATGVLSALVVQIGEQVDYLRFMPDKSEKNRLRWWAAVISAGPGWIVIGGLKILAGSLLAVLVVNQGLAPGQAVEPIRMYVTAYDYVSTDPWLVLTAATVFVLISQVKINVTNAYAGSLAWSNFYARVTHYHPGRVVWLIFNILISLLLMLLGVFETLETVLAVYSMVAVAWIGAIFADLAVLKPIGISPSFIEFRRAHLYDVNPVGCGAMAMASIVSVAAFAGLFGETAEAYAAGLSLVTAFLGAIAIGLVTRGRYYIAREDRFTRQFDGARTVPCAICTYAYEARDMAYCPFYAGPICSLCCSLDAHCHDRCKQPPSVGGRDDAADDRPYSHLLPPRIGQRLAKFAGVFLVLAVIVAAVFLLAYRMVEIDPTFVTGDSAELLIELYLASLVLICMAAWWIVLSHESRELAERELVTSLEELSETRLKLMQSERRRSLVGSMQKLSTCTDLRALSRCLLEEAIILTSAAGGEVALASGDRIVIEPDGKRTRSAAWHAAADAGVEGRGDRHAVAARG